MEVQVETSYVVRMTRFDVAKVLVAPNELQMRLRALLAESDTQVVEGEINTPALPAPARAQPSPRVKKIMRQFKKPARLTECPHGCGKFKRLGLHLVKAHNGKDGATSDGKQTE